MKYTCEAIRRMSGEHAQNPYYYHPYRVRKNSTTSIYSDDSSSSSSASPSGSMTSPPPPPSTSYENSEVSYQTVIFNRLKQYISEMPKDPMVCQILLESLSHVIELEKQLAELEKKTHHLKMAATQKSAPQNEKVPEDLANVDVTEFKHLVHSAPLVYESISY